MTINNTTVVDTTLKHIVRSKGIKDEVEQVLVDAEKLTDGNNKSLVSLIECYYLIEGTGTLTLSASSEENDLTLTGKGKYGLRPDQLKFGKDKQILLTTDSNVKSYLLVTEFRRNN
jgi:transcription antitermination factor NusG